MVALPLKKLPLTNIVYHVASAHQTTQFQDLVNTVIAHQERCLFEDLIQCILTIPARISPTGQISTL